jgi:hypothetical protein
LVVVHERGVVDDGCGANKGCSPAGLDAAQAGKTWLAVNTVASVTAVVGAAVGLVLILTSGSKASTGARVSAASF